MSPMMVCLPVRFGFCARRRFRVRNTSLDLLRKWILRRFRAMRSVNFDAKRDTNALLPQIATPSLTPIITSIGGIAYTRLYLFGIAYTQLYLFGIA